MPAEASFSPPPPPDPRKFFAASFLGVLNSPEYGNSSLGVRGSRTLIHFISSPVCSELGTLKESPSARWPFYIWLDALPFLEGLCLRSVVFLRSTLQGVALSPFCLNAPLDSLHGPPIGTRLWAELPQFFSFLWLFRYRRPCAPAPSFFSCAPLSPFSSVSFSGSSGFPGGSALFFGERLPAPDLFWDFRALLDLFSAGRFP